MSAKLVKVATKRKSFIPIVWSDELVQWVEANFSPKRFDIAELFTTEKAAQRFLDTGIKHKVNGKTIETLKIDDQDYYIPLVQRHPYGKWQDVVLWDGGITFDSVEDASAAGAKTGKEFKVIQVELPI